MSLDPDKSTQQITRSVKPDPILQPDSRPVTRLISQKNSPHPGWIRTIGKNPYRKKGLPSC